MKFQLTIATLLLNCGAKRPLDQTNVQFLDDALYDDFRTFGSMTDGDEATMTARPVTVAAPEPVQALTQVAREPVYDNGLNFRIEQSALYEEPKQLPQAVVTTQTKPAQVDQFNYDLEDGFDRNGMWIGTPEPTSDDEEQDQAPIYIPRTVATPTYSQVEEPVAAPEIVKQSAPISVPIEAPLPRLAQAEETDLDLFHLFKFDEEATESFEQMERPASSSAPSQSTDFTIATSSLDDEYKSTMKQMEPIVKPKNKHHYMLIAGEETMLPEDTDDKASFLQSAKPIPSGSGNQQKLEQINRDQAEDYWNGDF